MLSDGHDRGARPPTRPAAVPGRCLAARHLARHGDAGLSGETRARDHAAPRRIGRAAVDRSAASRAERDAGEQRRDQRSVVRGASRGWHRPFSGHCESPCFRPKPQAFIMPTWQMEKSKRTGSSGSSRAQRRGDVGRHLPAGAGVARQPQAAAEPDDVRVERHDQPRRRDARPDAEVDFVAPHHPAQEQVQPLAGAAGRRPRKEVAHAGPLRHAAVGAPEVERQRAASRSCRAPRRRPASRSSVVRRERNARSIPTARASAAAPRAAPRCPRRASSGAPSPAAPGAARAGSNCRTNSRRPRPHDREAACRSS